MEKANKKTARALKVANSCPPPSSKVMHRFDARAVDKVISRRNHKLIIVR